MVLFLLLLGTLFIPARDVWARLPKPIRARGTIRAVHLDSQTLMFEPAKGKKPFLLGWNKDTEFNRDGKSVPAAELKPGIPVAISYRDVSFHNALLKIVKWATHADEPGSQEGQNQHPSLHQR